MSEELDPAFRPGRRLTVHEMSHFKEKLVEWQSPERLTSVRDQLVEIAGRQTLCLAGASILFRNAHIAAATAKALQAPRVRLHSGDRPDFELEGGTSLSKFFEATEADRIGRRRGDEFREDFVRFDSGDYSYEYEAPEEVLAAAPERLSAAADRKLSRKYDSSWGLVIYFNATNWGRLEREIIETFTPATARAGQLFKELYILWSGSVFLSWRDGGAILPARKIERSEV